MPGHVAASAGATSSRSRPSASTRCGCSCTGACWSRSPAYATARTSSAVRQAVQLGGASSSSTSCSTCIRTRGASTSRPIPNGDLSAAADAHAGVGRCAVLGHVHRRAPTLPRRRYGRRRPRSAQAWSVVLGRPRRHPAAPVSTRGAWLAGAFAARSHRRGGYDLFNEPNPGLDDRRHGRDVPRRVPPPSRSRRSARPSRGRGGLTKIAFFEPMATWSATSAWRAPSVDDRRPGRVRAAHLRGLDHRRQGRHRRGGRTPPFRLRAGPARGLGVRHPVLGRRVGTLLRRRATATT